MTDEQVTVRCMVPSNLMRLIEDQKYFGRSREQFFSDAVKAMVSGYLSELDYDKMKKLKRKFNVEEEQTVIMA